MCKTTLLAKYGFAASFVRVEAGVSGDHMLMARQRQLPAGTPAGPRAQHAPSPLLLTPAGGDGLPPARAEEPCGPGAALGARGTPAPAAGRPEAAGLQAVPAGCVPAAASQAQESRGSDRSAHCK